MKSDVKEKFNQQFKDYSNKTAGMIVTKLKEEVLKPGAYAMIDFAISKLEKYLNKQYNNSERA